MKKIKRYFLSIVLFLLLFVITFYFIFSKYSINEFLKTISSCHFSYIFLSFGCVLIYLGCGTFFTRRMFQYFGIKISRFQSLCYNAIEIYFSAVTPSSTGGQPVEAYYMSKNQIPYRKSTVVILLNTILYKVSIVLLGLIGMILFPKLIFGNGTFFILLMFVGMALNMMVIFFFLSLLFSKKLPSKILRFGMRVMSFFHLLKPEDVDRKENEMKEALHDYQVCSSFICDNPWRILRLFLWILIQRLSLFSIGAFLYLAFGLSTYSFLTVLFLQVAITQAIDSVPLPGGVMVGESLTYQVNAFIYGSSLAHASMLLMRGISFYFLVLLCSILFVIFHFMSVRKRVNL